MKLRDVGFQRVVEQKYGISTATMPVLDTEIRSTESLYIEGIRWTLVGLIELAPDLP